MVLFEEGGIAIVGVEWHSAVAESPGVGDGEGGEWGVEALFIFVGCGSDFFVDFCFLLISGEGVVLALSGVIFIMVWSVKVGHFYEFLIFFVFFVAFLEPGCFYCFFVLV